MGEKKAPKRRDPSRSWELHCTAKRNWSTIAWISLIWNTQGTSPNVHLVAKLRRTKRILWITVKQKQVFFVEKSIATQQGVIIPCNISSAIICIVNAFIIKGYRTISTISSCMCGTRAAFSLTTCESECSRWFVGPYNNKSLNNYDNSIIMYLLLHF